MKKRAIEIGTTTITAPYTRLLRKFEREGVMAAALRQAREILGSGGDFLP
jgi:hypothetical protein